MSGIRLKSAGSAVHVRNNVIQTTGGLPLVHADSAGRAALLNGNAYWSSGASFRIRWGGTSYSSLSAWRSASGREKIGSVATGLSADPRLGAAGAAPTLGDAYRVSSLTQYKPRPGSPLLNAAVALASPHAAYTPATADFFGVGRLGGAWDIGVSEGA